MKKPFRYSVLILTISDKGSKGEREDKSGPLIKAMLEKEFEVRQIKIIPDEKDIIAETLRKSIDEDGIDIVITTGGTGVTKRDVTPEATRMILEKELPGFSEIMRMKSYEITPNGIISRAVCGIRKESLIINLPGSPKAAQECLSFILSAIPHTMEKLKGDTTECATQ